MQKILGSSIGLVLLVVIFGSGWIIYGWNRLQGKDLSQPPQFNNLSDYDKYAAQFPDLNAKTTTTAPQDAATIATEEKKAGTFVFEFLPDNIYLKNSFRLSTAAETNNMIRNFISDFPDLKNMVIDNLEAPRKFSIELPVLNREKIMTALTKNKEVAALIAKEAPIWDLELKEGKYEKDAVAFLAKFAGVKLATIFPANLDYIARINIAGQKEKLANTLANLQKNYSDVVVIR